MKTNGSARSLIVAAVLLAGIGCSHAVTRPILHTPASGALHTTTPRILVPPAITPISATIGGRQVYLLYANDFPLYYNTADSPARVTCTGSCAKVWRPLLAKDFPAGQLPPVSVIPGHITFVNDANGRQAEYNGHPLYIYARDLPGQRPRGQGIGNRWFAVTSTLNPPS